MDLRLFLLAALSAFIGSLGQLEFKRGAGTFEFDVYSFITNIHLMSGIILYIFSTIIYIYVLREGRLSIIYPIIATSYIWTTIFARVFLNEPINIVTWAGIALILLGVTLITYR
jgi:drug/metabolite transporter (DMT)-like permease